MNIRDEKGLKTFLKCLRETHAFRAQPRYLKELRDSEKEMTVKVSSLLELSDEEIIEEFGNRETPEFVEKVWPYFDYLRKSNHVEDKVYSQIEIFSQADVAKEMARAEIKKQPASVFTRARHVFFLKTAAERAEEQRRTNLILADLSELKGRFGKSEQVKLSLVISAEECQHFSEQLQKAVHNAQRETLEENKAHEQSLAEASFYRTLGKLPFGSMLSIPPPWVARADIQLARGIKTPQIAEGEVSFTARKSFVNYKLRQGVKKGGLEPYRQKIAAMKNNESRETVIQEPVRE